MLIPSSLRTQAISDDRRLTTMMVEDCRQSPMMVVEAEDCRRRTNLLQIESRYGNYRLNRLLLLLELLADTFRDMYTKYITLLHTHMYTLTISLDYRYWWLVIDFSQSSSRWLGLPARKTRNIRPKTIVLSNHPRQIPKFIPRKKVQNRKTKKKSNFEDIRIMLQSHVRV